MYILLHMYAKLLVLITRKMCEHTNTLLSMHAFTYLHTCTHVGVSPPEQLLFVTNSGSQMYGAGVAQSYGAVNPVAINTLSRLMYWYNSTTNSIMVQSLDGNDVWVS